MRAWEPEPGEVKKGAKAWGAFKVFRDLGPHRTLKTAAAAYFGVSEQDLTDSQYGQIRRWSSRFDWIERAQGFDDWLTMRRQAVIEDYVDTQSAQFAERQLALREELLGVAEKLADGAEKMANWPLSQQKLVREGEDGEEQTLIVMPAGWSKQTAVQYYNAAAGAVAGTWSTRQLEEGDEEAWDFDELTEEEVLAYIEITEKLGVKPPRRRS